MFIITLIANARYLLMSCALSQRMNRNMPLYQKLIIGHYVTDEIFAIAVARRGELDPYYVYGAISLASPGWVLGTALGALAGALMPARLVSAFGVALYGMFLAVIIPKAKESKVLAGACCGVLRTFLCGVESSGCFLTLRGNENHHSHGRDFSGRRNSFPRERQGYGGVKRES